MSCPLQNPSSSTEKQPDLQAENQQLKQELASVKRQLNWFKQQLFGQKTEKRMVDESGRQGSLFEALLNETSVASESPKQTITYQRGKGPKSRDESCVTEQGLRFDDQVPVEVITLEAPELKGPDADDYQVIDYKITRRLAQRPSSYVVLEYRRPVLKHQPTQQLQTMRALPAIFDKSMADVSVLVGLLVDKFVYHLPLYRQHQRIQQAGITLSRGTLTGWVQRAIDLLSPIYDAQLENILRSKILAMDETPIKAGKKQKGKMHQAWFWPIYGDADEIAFTFSPTRAARHIQTQLKDFEGILLCDGYTAYDRFAKKKASVTLAQCWVHLRRYFVKAQKSEPEATEQALDMIGALYYHEKQMTEANLKGQAVIDYRNKHARPIVDAFFAWCHEQQQRLDLVNSDPFSRALTYVDNHISQLKVFLSEPELQMDTNHLERALRVIPMGKKNWMFCWSEVGAKQVGVIQSLVSTCRLHDIDPYTYLVDVLQRVAEHPAKQIEELTPRIWKTKFAQDPMKSDLDKITK